MKVTRICALKASTLMTGEHQKGFGYEELFVVKRRYQTSPCALVIGDSMIEASSSATWARALGEPSCCYLNLPVYVPSL